MALVLLVEDVEDMRKLIVETLMMDDHQVLEAGNGREALTLLQQTAQIPHLILTDVNMPIMDGWAFLAQVRASPSWKDVPVLILSGDAGDSDLTTQNRANGFLLKPFRTTQLMKLLEDLLR